MKQQIINDIISELIIEKCASTFKSYLTDEYYRDFILEMYLQLFDINEDKLIKLYNKNQLNYYIIAMCRNNATNSKSKFWRLHRSKVELIYIEDYKLIFDDYEDS